MIRSTAIITAAFLALSCAASAATSNDSNSAQKLVNDSVPVVGQIKQDPHFVKLLKQAKGVLILPAVGKGALIAGGEGGQGVLLMRRNGKWTDPAFLSLGSISLGPQAGGAGGPVVMLLMTDKAAHSFSQANNLSLNANAGLTIVNYSAKGQGSVGKGDIIVWSNQSGAFAGASVSATDITSNTQQDRAYYGRHVSTTDIIKGKVHNAAADKLVSDLPA